MHTNRVRARATSSISASYSSQRPLFAIRDFKRCRRCSVRRTGAKVNMQPTVVTNDDAYYDANF